MSEWRLIKLIDRLIIHPMRRVPRIPSANSSLSSVCCCSSGGVGKMRRGTRGEVRGEQSTVDAGGGGGIEMEKAMGNKGNPISALSPSTLSLPPPLFMPFSFRHFLRFSFFRPSGHSPADALFCCIARSISLLLFRLLLLLCCCAVPSVPPLSPLSHFINRCANVSH